MSKLENLAPWHKGLCTELKVARVYEGLTLQQASKRLIDAGHNIYPADLSAYETGKRVPGLARLYALAVAYETDVHEIIPPFHDSDEWPDDVHD